MISVAPSPSSSYGWMVVNVDYSDHCPSRPPECLLNYRVAAPAAAGAWGSDMVGRCGRGVGGSYNEFFPGRFTFIDVYSR